MWFVHLQLSLMWHLFARDVTHVFHVPSASASQVPAEGSGSGRQLGCLTGAIASRVAGKTLGAAGLECFGQGSNLQLHWFHPFDHLVLGTPYLQFREIAAASVERSSRLFHIYIYIIFIYIYAHNYPYITHMTHVYDCIKQLKAKAILRRLLGNNSRWHRSKRNDFIMWE